MTTGTTGATIEVVLNGSATTAAEGISLAGLLDARGIERRLVAVEHNGEILPRREWEATILQDGDKLEVVQMVGGG